MSFFFFLRNHKNNKKNIRTDRLYDIFYRQLIYNYPEQLFSDNGVLSIEHADFEGVERLALVTGNGFMKGNNSSC